jgi:ribose transport system substrate-binding protein
MALGDNVVDRKSRLWWRVGAVMICIALAGLAVACGSDDDSADSGGTADATNAEGDKKTIGVSVPDTTWPWFTTFDKVIEEQLESEGWAVVLLSGGGDPVKQADTIAELVSREIDLLIVAPVDGKALVPAVRSASRADIPVLMTADPIADEGLEHVAAQTVADNCEQARLAAQAMADAVDGDGDVITLQGLAGQPAVVARTNCFEEELGSVAPGLRIVDSQPYDWDPVKAQSVAEDLLTRHPDVVGVWVHDDNAAAAVCEVLTKKKADPVMVSTGGSKNGVAAVSDGCLTATVRQSPTTQAEEAASLARTILAGEDFSKQNVSPMPVITADNADEYPGDW